ncbi:4'-phosphopantetheinyl transferase family protein [Sulfitobacter mediterraneus]|uniref:4'-phosphopantetheinyl transferase family protein n=1 Tax=Sulfitobacter mediterraneus TaxID=83219 RepID=UPI0021A55609|nr:4'-phosphopantetheinyl transferase superfamily protein [Sulfitobacter mediterraneus]UWR12635.1 4'-phosphopantetheinyl transferase superfamily protein [Sulfitobacter mediterraneus]
MIEACADDDAALIQAAVAALFDGAVAVAVADPHLVQPAIWPEEAQFVAQAVPKRRAEFAAGRSAARAAMRMLGGPDIAIPASADRAPSWPAGWHGSISHNDRWCLAAVTRGAAHLGVDIEAATPLNPDLLSTICSPAEVVRIAGADQGMLAKVVFSAKEAAYKAQYPLTEALFGFDHLDVVLAPQTGQFQARFVQPAGQFAAGDVLQGRFAMVRGQIVTAVTIDPMKE